MGLEQNDEAEQVMQIAPADPQQQDGAEDGAGDDNQQIQVTI